jgi:uncharacterized protein
MLNSLTTKPRNWDESYYIMVHYFKLIGLALVLSVGMGSVGSAASFGCNKATTKTEIAICADPELSALDEEMAEAWMRLDGQVSKSNQFQWLIERDA